MDNNIDLILEYFNLKSQPHFESIKTKLLLIDFAITFMELKNRNAFSISIFCVCHFWAQFLLGWKSDQLFKQASQLR